MANFLSNLFYSIAYPVVHFTLIKDVGEKMIAFNSIIMCLAGVLFPIIWNKHKNLYRAYGQLLLVEGIVYSIVGILICTSAISNLAYYLLDTFLFALISKNIICGSNKLRAMRYNSEIIREQYDNNSTIVSNFSSLLGFGISFIVTIPVNIAFILITIGICVDNVFYYRVYKQSLKINSQSKYSTNRSEKMSKLNLKLNYKNACILKHALRDKIKQKEEWINANRDGVYNTMEDEIKELEEEKRALAAITEEIKRCGFMHNNQVFG